MLLRTTTEADKALKDKFLRALGLTAPLDRPTWPLPNAKQVKDHDYWRHISCWGEPRLSAWADRRQINGEWATLLIYFVDHEKLIGGGFAVLSFYSPKQRVEYWEWRDCDHVFHEKRLGNCWHRHTCEKCGRAFEVDSSD